jgi:hypothetical protein
LAQIKNRWKDCLSPRGSVQNHPHFFQRDQSAFHHLIQPRQDLIDAFLRFNHFQNNWQILREPQQFVSVIDAGPAIPARAA